MKTCLLTLILLSATAIHAESFTVLAKNGLNVRQEPNGSAKKVGTLPFGTVVDAEISYDRDVEYTLGYKHYSEIIEGKRGFWMKITFGKIEGYIFSGFGLLGEWVVKSTEINKEYRLLQVGGQCAPINYDPKLQWYAMVKNNGRMSLQKAEVYIKLVHEFTEKDKLDMVNEDWGRSPLVVSSDITDSVFFLVGAATSLQAQEIYSEFLGEKRWGYSEESEFLYPEETFFKHYKGKNYTFHAYEAVTLTRENTEGYLKQYQIELLTGLYPEIKTINLSPDLGNMVSAQRHAYYKTPQLIWIGDLNSDGLLDFIYYSHTMSDGCGVSWNYDLFLSDKNNPQQPIRKVADELQGNCFT